MAKLAMDGGTRVAPQGLKQKWPIYGELEERMLLETLRAGIWCSFLTAEGMVARARKAFAEFVGTKYAMCDSSGTDAIHVALRAGEIHEGAGGGRHSC